MKFAGTIVLLIALAVAADSQSPKSLRGSIAFRLQPISRGEKRAFHVDWQASTNRSGYNCELLFRMP